MVDRDERDSAREGERLAGREPDEKRADQPGPGGRRDQIDLLDRRVSLGERLLEGDREVLEVRSGRDLGDDAAVRSVRGELRGDNVREHAAVPVEDRNGGLVAGSFDAEDEHGFPSGEDGKPFLACGLGQAVVEADEGQALRALVAEDESRCELESVGRAQRVCSEEPKRPCSHAFH